MRDEYRGRRTSYLADPVGWDVFSIPEGCLMEIINLGKADGLPPVDWPAVAEKLAAGSAPAPGARNSRTTWLSTLNEDGSPHVTAVGALWLDGRFWFQTGAGTRKGRNVARDPRCSIAVSVRDADVVVEGEAARVTDPGAVARIAKAWADNGWPAEPDDSGSGITAPFNAPSQASWPASLSCSCGSAQARRQGHSQEHLIERNKCTCSRYRSATGYRAPPHARRLDPAGPRPPGQRAPPERSLQAGKGERTHG
jgi:Pyridoxamine 5'-phosphate oxidase